MEDDNTMWEEYAQEAVQQAWDSIEYDEVRGVMLIPDRDDPRRGTTECKDIDDVRIALAQIYLSEWHGYVPYDSGEAVFEADEDGYVGDFMSDNREAEEFFESLSVKEYEDELFDAKDSILPDHSRNLRIDLEEINDELIRHLARHPHLMRELDPRKFETLIAELLKAKGYEIELTQPSKDGGRDILAIRRDDIGTALTLVECKRYAAHNKVGVEIVRGLYGVLEAEKATRGLIATTSYFTKGATSFRDTVQFRLGLADFDVLRGMLSQFKKKQT